jgi:hypothetical protein
VRNFLWRLIYLEPALWRALIVTAFTLLLSLGVAVSPDIPNSVIGFILASAPVAQALWTRGAVTPNAKVAVKVPDPEKPDEVTPGDAVTTATPRSIVAAAQASGNESL